MGLEIERKFLVTDDRWRAQVHHRDRLIQGYLVGAAGAPVQTRCAIRIRMVNDHQAWLTIKSANPALTRQEFEYAIPVADAQAMLDTLGEGRIEKLRHHVFVADTHFEVDEFLGDNAGLVLAEVELPSEDAPHAHPEWLGQDVSHERRYYNVELARHPFVHWSKEVQSSPRG